MLTRLLRPRRRLTIPIEDHTVPTIQCPGCDTRMPSDDGWAQKLHMETEHPEIVAERLKELEKWAGWVND